MSYILQALKKSEQERELAEKQGDNHLDDSFKSTPEDISAPHVLKEKESNSSWSLYAVYLALLAVMLLILWQILLPSKSVEHEEMQLEARQEAKIETKTKVENRVSKEETDSRGVLVPQQSLNVPHADSIAVEQAPISVEQAPREILAQLPNIEITSHIYSTDAGRRSIVVNGERLVEGDFIAPNVQLKQITAQGMMIDIQGWSLLVGRSRGWGQ